MTSDGYPLPKNLDNHDSDAAGKDASPVATATPPVNVFENHQGKTSDRSPVATRIERFRFLTFQIEERSFQNGVNPVDLVNTICPSMELRRIGIDPGTGKSRYHCVINLKSPVRNSTQLSSIYCQFQRALLADPSSNLKMLPRVVGSIRKDGDGEFLVEQIQAGEPVGFRELAQIAKIGWRKLLFRALTVSLLRSENGDVLRQGFEEEQGTCAIHGRRRGRSCRRGRWRSRAKASKTSDEFSSLRYSLVMLAALDVTKITTHYKEA